MRVGILEVGKRGEMLMVGGGVRSERICRSASKKWEN